MNGKARPSRAGSVRLRLTLLYASLFLISGAGLLGISYGLLSNANNGIISVQISSDGPLNGAAPAGPANSGPANSGPANSGSANSGPANSGPANSGSANSRSIGGSGGLALTDPNAGTGPFPDPQQVQAQAKQYVAATRAREDDALLLYFGIALGIMVVVAAGLGWFVAGRALRPLRRITESARRISATNLHERLAIDGPDDDLRELADMIDGLFARLDASSRAQRQFVANASHELRTPLARSQALLEVALRNPAASATSLRAACERAIAAGTEQERLIEALLILARGQRGLDHRAPLDLAAVTRDALASLGERIAASGLRMEITLQPGLLAGDTALVERAIANLTDNALRHNAPGGSVWISVGSDEGRAFLTIANTGQEIPPEAVERLLLPFQRGAEAEDAYRARRRSGPDDGLGLGLSIVAAIASAHDADLSVTPRLTGGGLTIRFTFPAPPPAVASAVASLEPASACDVAAAR